MDIKDQCKNPTQQLTIQIPCVLAERVDAYASRIDSTITHVVIEALDVFLRNQQDRTD